MYGKKVERWSFLGEEGVKRKARVLAQANSMASFTGVFDAYKNSMIYVKLH